MSKVKLQQPVIHLPSVKEYKITLAYLRSKYLELGVEIPFPPSDYYYWHTDVDGFLSIASHLLFKSSLYKPDRFDCPLPKDLAFAFGLFFADGYCDLRNGNSSGASWKITNTKPELLERCIAPLEREWINLKFTVKTYPSEAKGEITNYGLRNMSLYNLEASLRDRHNDSSKASFIRDFRQMFYTDLKYKKVPGCVLESPLDTKRDFMEGVIEGDGYKAQHKIGVKGIPGRDSLILVLNDLGWLGAVTREDRRDDFWYLRYTFRNQWDALFLEFLENNKDTFYSVKQLGDKFGLRVSHAIRVVDRLEKAGNVLCERLWSKRRKVKFLLGQIPHCEDYALKAQGLCAELFGINALRYTYGTMPLGAHGFCSHWCGDDFLLLEPNSAFIQDPVFEIGYYEYVCKAVLL